MQLDLIAKATSPKGKTLEYYTCFLMQATYEKQLDGTADRIRTLWTKRHPKAKIEIKIVVS